MTDRTYVFDKEILIFGLKRSGTHALVSWLFAHFKKGQVIFQNNSYLTTFDRGRTNMKTFSLEDRYSDSKRIYINTVEHISADFIVPGIEHFRNVTGRYYPRKLDRYRFSKEKYQVLCIRNPFNNFASIIGNDRFMKLFAKAFEKYWLSYYNLMVGEPTGVNVFIRRKCKKIEFTPFVFDKWFADIEYRKRLAEKLNLDFTDTGLNKVGSIGSSFDGKKFSGNAQKMDVLNRWQNFKDDRRMKKVVRHTFKQWNKLYENEAY